MTFLIALRDCFWPWLERLSAEEVEDLKKRYNEDKDKIDKLKFDRDADAALDEARRMAESEAERRRGTDQKAATYLPLVAALIPLTLAVVSALWERKVGSAPGWLNISLLGVSVAYTAAAGFWAFRVLEVTISHEAGIGDFDSAWNKPHPKGSLARKILLYTRLNHGPINQKVSRIKMAHAFLLRAFLTFSLLLAVNIVWYFIASVRQTPENHRTERQIVVAREEPTIDRLADQLRVTEAWTVLNAHCRNRWGTSNRLDIRPSPPAPSATLPAVLKPTRDQLGLVRDLELSCAGRSVGRARTWYLRQRVFQPAAPNNLPEPLNMPLEPIIVALKQEWGLAEGRNIPTVVRQTVLMQDSNGRGVAVVETDIVPNSLSR